MSERANDTCHREPGCSLLEFAERPRSESTTTTDRPNQPSRVHGSGRACCRASRPIRIWRLETSPAPSRGVCRREPAEARCSGYRRCGRHREGRACRQRADRARPGHRRTWQSGQLRAPEESQGMVRLPVLGGSNCAGESSMFARAPPVHATAPPVQQVHQPTPEEQRIPSRISSRAARHGSADRAFVTDSAARTSSLQHSRNEPSASYSACSSACGRFPQSRRPTTSRNRSINSFHLRLRKKLF